MKLRLISAIAMLAIALSACQKDDDGSVVEVPEAKEVNFQHLTTINAGGTTEISAFDAISKKLFTVNPDANEVMVFDLSNISSPKQLNAIDVSALGTPNSVSVYGDMLAIAVEASNKQANGNILVYNTDSQALQNTFSVGALPDMVLFSPDGKYIVTANEGEPSAD